MVQPPFDRITELLKSALALPPAERPAYLDAQCNGDHALRAAVEHQLQGQESATLFEDPGTVDGPPIPPIPSDARSERTAAVPRRIASYTVRDILGEGGMGVVYLAEQDRPRRTVALKVIRPGLLSTRMLRRFEHESQMLARLQHPGIAQIHEAGTAEAGSGPQPFFAMEYVRGEALTAFAKRPGVSRRQRLELFIKVCEAVQHAHAKGVIHRDLKPGNILVDASGQPKVLDFGVARATDSDVQSATFQTDVGQLVGTIPYMSPEQVAGDPAELDTRSDVYTLGAILYELLAGHLPHALEGMTLPEAVRVIGQEEPPSLSTNDRTLRGDLETIVGKALERDKSRRYQTASDLAADIERYLSDEPILARPPSTTYQLRKFATRNRGLVLACAGAALVLVAGIIGTSWQAVQATRGRELAEKRRLEADAANGEAQTEAANAEAISGYFTTMLSSIDPDYAQGREVTVREMVDASAKTIGTAFPGRSRVEVSVRSTLANSYKGIGHLKDAEGQASAALELARRTLGPEHPQTLAAQRQVAMLSADQGHLDEAETLAQSTYDTQLRLHGDDHPDTADAESDLARILQDKGRWTQSEAMVRHALEVLRAARGERHDTVLALIHNLGTVLKDEGKLEEAETCLRQALTLRADVYGPEHPQTQNTINSLAACIQKRGRNQEAAELLEKLLGMRRRTMGDEHPVTLTTISNLAVCYIGLKRYTEAEPLLREAMAVQLRTLGEEHPKTMVTYANLAYLLEDVGRDDEAEAIYRHNIELRRRVSGGQNPETWAPMNNLASLYLRRGRPRDAEPLFKDVVELGRQALPPDHYYLALFRSNYAECLTALGRYDEAEEMLTASLPVLEKTFGPGHARVKQALQRAVKLYEAWGKADKASEYRARLEAK